MRRIYLDYAATAPLVAAAAERMAGLVREPPANPSSLHADGRRARRLVDEARERICEAMGCDFGELYFTSGGTEAAQLAIVGTALANSDPNRTRVLIGAAEHPCVLETGRWLARLGYTIERIPVDREARVELDALAASLDGRALLVSVMHANNELGSLNPVAEAADLAHRVGAWFHTDAVQTFLNQASQADTRLVEATGADLISVSAHKLGGPQGVGALYARAGTKLEPIINGGGQEREMRAGTENVIGIVGFGEAVRYRLGDLANQLGTARAARDAFMDRLGKFVGQSMRPSVTSGSALESFAHLRFPGVPAESLLIRLDQEGMSAGSGSACSSGSLEPSHVLLACGYSSEEAQEGMRFTFGPESSVEDALRAAEVTAECVRSIAQAHVGAG
jgi:cysteine desulfurase